MASWIRWQAPAQARAEHGRIVTILATAPPGLEPEHVGRYVSVIDTIEDLVVVDVRALSPARRLVIASARVRAVLSLDVLLVERRVPVRWLAPETTKRHRLRLLRWRPAPVPRDARDDSQPIAFGGEGGSP